MMRKPYHGLWEILADELREAIRRLYLPGRDQQRLADQKQVYALIQELQRLYDEPDFPREAFDGRDPRPPFRQQFIQPPGITAHSPQETLTEWETALVEDWEKNNHKYPLVKDFARHHGTSRSHLYKVLDKAERVNKKKYKQGKGRKRR